MTMRRDWVQVLRRERDVEVGVIVLEREHERRRGGDPGRAERRLRSRVAGHHRDLVQAADVRRQAGRRDDHDPLVPQPELPDGPDAQVVDAADDDVPADPARHEGGRGRR